MAQWSGGYQGETHTTRVAGAEAALRHGVSVLQTATSDGDRSKAARNVCQLAARLLSARVRKLKARLEAIEDAAAGGRPAPYAIADNDLRARLAATRELGLPGILTELSVGAMLVSEHQR